MSSLTLYTTAGCHLCEIAHAMLIELGPGQRFRLELVDIADSPQLVEQYGISIPVVKNPETGRELGWPFSVAELETLLG